MKKLYVLGGVALVATLVGVWAWAQPLLPQLLTGNELINITLPSGSGATTTINAVRGAVTSRVVTQNNGTILTAFPDQNVILTGNGTLAVRLPNPAQNGDWMQITNGGSAAITSLSITSTTGPQTQALAPGITYNAQATPATTTVWWVYVWTDPTGNGTWYRIH